MLRLEQVSKHFQQGEHRLVALDRVDLTVGKGEFLSIMGPSGSGKSTLLHLMGGLDTLSGGEILIDDRPMSQMSDDEVTLFRRRHIGFVFQFFNLLPTLTAEENVALPLLLDGRLMRDIRPRVEHMLEMVGMSPRQRHLPGQLSGGEMQRIAIARALVIEPLVLLADEPIGNLDTQNGAQILSMIRDASTRGQTVVMVTHDAHATEYGHRRVTLVDGRITDDVRIPRAAGGRPA